MRKLVKKSLFDVILFEHCPLNSHLSILNKGLIDNLKKFLKKDGYLLITNMKRYEMPDKNLVFTPKKFYVFMENEGFKYMFTPTQKYLNNTINIFQKIK